MIMKLFTGFLLSNDAILSEAFSIVIFNLYTGASVQFAFIFIVVNISLLNISLSDGNIVNIIGGIVSNVKFIVNDAELFDGVLSKQIRLRLGKFWFKAISSPARVKLEFIDWEKLFVSNIKVEFFKIHNIELLLSSTT